MQPAGPWPPRPSLLAPSTPQGVVDSAKRDKYVSTMGGRRRWLPGFEYPPNASDGKHAAAERQAVNTVCQVRARLICRLQPAGSNHNGSSKSLSTAHSTPHHASPYKALVPTC